MRRERMAHPASASAPMIAPTTRPPSEGDGTVSRMPTSFFATRVPRTNGAHCRQRTEGVQRVAPCPTVRALLAR